MKTTRAAALLASAACCAVWGQFVLAGPAAAVSVAKGELKNQQLRVGGRSAPGISVIVSSTTSAASARADQSGSFKVEASGFTAPDCTVVVSDGNRTPTATVTLAGCTRSVVPVPPTPAPPTGACTITPSPPTALAVDANAVVNFQTTGCDTTTGSGATPTPVRWRVVAGSIPVGMTGPNAQGTTAGNIIGTPTVPGRYAFTLQVSDQLGATDQETFTVTVSQPAAVTAAATTEASSGAAGDDWTPYRTAPFQLSAGTRCPFGLAGTPVRDRERIRTVARFPDGTPRVQEIAGPLVVRYTNTDTGATVRRNLAGRATVTYREDGSFTESLTHGHFAFGLAGTDPGGPGFFVVSGSGFNLTVLASGGRSIALGTGRVENLCTTLSATS